MLFSENWKNNELFILKFLLVLKTAHFARYSCLFLEGTDWHLWKTVLTMRSVAWLKCHFNLCTSKAQGQRDTGHKSTRTQVLSFKKIMIYLYNHGK